MTAVVSPLASRSRPVLVRLVATAEIPAGDAWLGPRESEVLAALRFPKRHADWRLGHYAAKRAAAAWLRRLTDPASLARLEVLADEAGAPHLHGDDGTTLALSLSHRAGWALAAVAPPDVALGCDLELIQTRSAAFVADYLTAHEQTLVEAADVWDRAHWTTLIWCVKECALKALREGLRLDTRSVEITSRRGEPERGWYPIGARVLASGRTFAGWWRPRGILLACVVGDPGLEPPQGIG